jgi:hypothetical protein
MRATPTSFEDENACFRQNPDHVIFLSEIDRIKKCKEFVTSQTCRSPSEMQSSRESFISCDLLESPKNEDSKT